MNTIPLVKGNTQEEINTSLIALKKALDEMNSSSSKTDASVQSQIKQINELITNINSHLDTIDGQITDLQPVNSVTSGNMHSVTSNAVAQALSGLIKVKKVTLNNVVLNQNGVLNIENYIPSGINLLFALMWNWGAVSMDNYFGVSGDGRYIRGTPNNTIDWLVVAYFYVD